MTEEPTGSELERKLKADASGEERDAILAQLEGQARKTKQTMDSGVSPAEFAELEKQFKGFEAGVEVTTHVWRRFHAG